MPAQRIPDLTTIAAADLASDDKFVVYDLSEDKYKALTKDEFAIMLAASITPSFVIAQFVKADGAGSGTNADLLDGKQAAVFALLAGAAFTGNISVDGVLTVSGSTGALGPTIATEFAARPDEETTSGTLTSASANGSIFNAAVCIVNPNVFSAGDCISFFSTGATLRVRCGTGMNIFKDNDPRTPASAGDVFLDARETASILFVSPTEAYITGGGEAPP